MFFMCISVCLSVCLKLKKKSSKIYGKISFIYLCMFLFNGSSEIKIKFIAITVQHVIFHFIKCGLWQLCNTGGPGEQTWFVLCQLLASESVELA